MPNKDEVSPLDLLNPNNHGVPKDIQSKRLKFCEDCKHFKNQIKQCAICGCIMPLKVKLKDAWCPVGYWSVYENPIDKHFKLDLAKTEEE